MRTGAPDLDDVEQLSAADVDGLLRAAAVAGAQVRAIAEAQREGVAARLGDLRPRSVILVHGGSGAAPAAAALVVALVGAHIDVPLVCAPTLPGWVGTLDVVVVLGDDAGQSHLADGAARAVRRRAELVVAAPLEGPLADAAGGVAIDLSPRIDTDPRFRFAGFVAALVAVLTSLEQVRWQGQRPNLDEVADALDADATANHVGRETFRNRAKLLAARVEGGHPVWAGDTAATVAVAEHAARVVRGVAGTVTGAADLLDVVRTAREVWAGDSSGTDSLFYDPMIDGPQAQTPPRVLMISTAEREWLTSQRVSTLPDVDLLIGVSDGHAGGEPVEAVRSRDESLVPRISDPSAAVDRPTDVGSLLVVSARVELAAVYLRLIEGEGR